MKKDNLTTKLALAALFAALSYIGFTFFRIDIVLPGGKTAFHLGNVFCVLGALLIGGLYGGLAGAVGMTIADLTTGYTMYAPETFILKLCIGLIVGLVAHRVASISKEHDRSYVIKWTIVASICGMAFNVVASPIVGYVYQRFLLGQQADLAEALATLSALTTFVNAIIAVICASVFYLALRPALKKSGLFPSLSK